MKPSRNCANASTPVRFANGRTRADSASSSNWTARHSSHCVSDTYVLAYWKPVRANIDYHVEIERHYYSVPYQLVGEQLDARYTANTVEIFHRGTRVASHPRSYVAHKATTLPEHRPKSHQAHMEWTPSRLI